MVTWRGLILLALVGCAAPRQVPVSEAPAGAGEPRPTERAAAPEAPPRTSSTAVEPAVPAAVEIVGTTPEDSDPLIQALDLLQSGDEEAGLAGLRRELAEGERSLEAGLALASYLASRERVAEALGAIQAARSRNPGNPELALARAELLRDLGQREEAAKALREALALGASHPRLWFGLAELEWLLGRRDPAAEALARLREDHGDHPWVVQEEGSIHRLEQEVREQDAPTTMSARDLLGDLRGAPRSMDRYRALRVLASEAGDLKRQAVTIALNDRDPSVRVQALRLGDWSLSEAERLSRRALTDPAPSVRAAAIPLSRRIDPRVAGDMILEALQAETDPDCFRLMHRALEDMRGVQVFLPPGAAQDPEARAEVLAEWRKVWGG